MQADDPVPAPQQNIGHAIRRIWFIACETSALGPMVISLYFEGSSRFYDPIAAFHRGGMIALLLTSLTYLGHERRMAMIGLLSCLILLFWGFIFTSN